MKVNIIGVGKVDVLEYTSNPARRALIHLDSNLYHQPYVIWYLTPADHSVYGENAFHADQGRYFSRPGDAYVVWRK
jgi:hypothetical protein